MLVSDNIRCLATKCIPSLYTCSSVTYRAEVMLVTTVATAQTTWESYPVEAGVIDEAALSTSSLRNCILRRPRRDPPPSRLRPTPCGSPGGSPSAQPFDAVSGQRRRRARQWRKCQVNKVPCIGGVNTHDNGLMAGLLVRLGCQHAVGRGGGEAAW